MQIDLKAIVLHAKKTKTLKHTKVKVIFDRTLIRLYSGSCLIQRV